MKILVSGSTRMVRLLAGRFPDRLDCLLTPRNGNTVASLLAGGLPWVADNGAFSGFDANLFRCFLAKVHAQPGCLWVVCPDVVADARSTIACFREWLPEVRATGQPVAFVGQDGAEDLDLPWEEFECWFIGGTTDWKLSRSSRDLALEAKRRGKWVHMGRCNSLARLRIAHRWGCDSVDGSGYSRFATVARAKGRNDMLLERHLSFLDGLDRQKAEQLLLFEEE